MLPFKFISKKIIIVFKILLSAGFLLLGSACIYHFLNNEENTWPSRVSLAMMISSFYLFLLAALLISVTAMIENFRRERSGQFEFFAPDRFGSFRKDDEAGQYPGYLYSQGLWLVLGLSMLWFIYKLTVTIL